MVKYEVSLHFISQLYFNIYESLNMTLISHDFYLFRPREEKNSLNNIIHSIVLKPTIL